MQNTNSKLNTILLIIIVILLAVGIYFLVNKKSSSPEYDEFSSVDQVQMNQIPETKNQTNANQPSMTSLSYTNEALGISFDFPKKYQSIKTFENSQTGQPQPLITNGTTGKQLFAFLAFEKGSFFYFGGLNSNYSGEHDGNVGITNKTTCDNALKFPGATTKTNKHGNQYVFYQMSEPDGMYGGETWYIAYFNHNTSEFPCLGFAAQASSNVTKEDFFIVVDSVKID